MAECAVIDTSPLIFLSRANHLDLLKHFYNRIVVPESVAAEVLAVGNSDPTAHALRTTAWLEIAPDGIVPVAARRWGLGRGETAVIVLAYSHPGWEVILDDRAARRAAQAQQIPVVGTLGLIVAAKNRGYLPSARSAIDELKAAGLFLTSTVIDEACKLANE